MTPKKDKPTIKLDRDGHTVWINDAERCLARFTERTGEIFTTDGGTAAVHSTDLLDQWKLWKNHVKVHHDIDVKDTSMPASLKRLVAQQTN